MLNKEKLKHDDIPQNFKHIFDNYYPLVCRQAAYLLGTTDLADDIAQEVFLKLYYSAPVELTNVGGWLGRVTVNLCYNYLKREKSRKNREARDSILKENNVIALENVIIKKQEVRLVREVLNKMNERDRMVLLLRFSGYRYSEIAEALEIDKNSVGTVLVRAQRKFKNLYLKNGGGA